MIFPIKTPEGLLWVGVEVVNRTDTDDTLAAAAGGRRLIWLRDLAAAEDVCANALPTREPLSIIFQRVRTTVTIDYGSPSFADFVDACRWELAFNPPDWDDPRQEELTRDAVRLLYAATEKGGVK